MEPTARPSDGDPARPVLTPGPGIGADPAGAPAPVEALQQEVLGLRTALESRAVIEQAKGVLMAKLGCDAEAAFAHLRRQSQYQNRRLREVAAELVAAQRHRRG